MSEFILLEIDKIDEDPNQPRTSENPGFSNKSLNELAETIKERGVKSPISVRHSENGRYIINHGARRFRASILAGMTSIPAFIDDNYTKLDQVIENIQRENLSPREIADYIGYRISIGAKKGDIAKDLGKSNAWISQYSNLLDLPEPIAKAMNHGKITDLTAINELIKLYNKSPQDVTEWISESDELNRANIQTMKEYINYNKDENNSPEQNIKILDERKKPGPVGPKAKIAVIYKNQICELRVIKPSQNGYAVISIDGVKQEVPLSELSLFSID